MRVDRVLPQDWPALKALRLEALLDSPVAYCEAYDDAVRAPDSDWQHRATRGAVGGSSFQALAWRGDAPVGTAVGFLDRGDAVLAAVYVAPASRGQGLLDELVRQVSAWAREQSALRLRLLVHESNAPAARAYERLGFGVTGHREPYPLGPGDEVEMARAL